MKIDLIHFLTSNSGLPSDMTWYDLGLKFNIQPPKPNKAKQDPKYKKKSIAKKTQDIWRKHLSGLEQLELQKQTYIEGELKTEVFKKVDTSDIKVNYEDFEIEAFTTNGPGGKPWLKGKRKINLFNEEHLSKLKEILKKEIKPIKLNYSESNEKGLFIYGSDKHIGALTKKDSLYKNQYDKKEMRRRIVIKTLENIKEKVELHGRFDSLFILDLGDAVDGFNNKTTGGLRGTSSHTLPQQYNNREQFDLYLEFHKELFDEIVRGDFANNIYFVATSNSNHGGDFEYTAMRSLQEYLSYKYPEIKSVINYKPYNHFLYGDHCIIFGHGKDDIDMKHGFPLTINQKVESLISDYIAVNKLEDFNVSVVTGDLHQSAETYAKRFRYKKVLSQFGSSKWAHTNYGSGTPGLSVEVFMKNNSKIYKDDTFFEIIKESNTGISF